MTPSDWHRSGDYNYGYGTGYDNVRSVCTPTTNKPGIGFVPAKTYYSSSKPAEVQTLTFHPLAWMKLVAFRDSCNTEIAGWGISSDSDPLYIEDFITIKQECTSATFEFDGEAIAAYMEKYTAPPYNWQPHKFMRILIHTHPGNSATPSGTDWSNFNEQFSNPDWAIMFILARGGETTAFMQCNVGPGGKLKMQRNLDVEIDYGCWYTWLEANASKMEEIFKGWKEERDANVQTKSWQGTSYTTGTGWGNPTTTTTSTGMVTNQPIHRSRSWGRGFGTGGVQATPTTDWLTKKTGQGLYPNLYDNKPDPEISSKFPFSLPTFKLPTTAVEALAFLSGGDCPDWLATAVTTGLINGSSWCEQPEIYLLTPELSDAGLSRRDLIEWLNGKMTDDQACGMMSHRQLYEYDRLIEFKTELDVQSAGINPTSNPVVDMYQLAEQQWDVNKDADTVDPKMEHIKSVDDADEIAIIRQLAVYDDLADTNEDKAKDQIIIE